MKKRFHILLTILIACLANQSILGQTSKQIKKSKDHYKTWVTSIDNSPNIKGYLSEVGDSLIIISDGLNYERQTIDINNIKKIKFRKKGSVGRGMLIGALMGVFTGGISGYADGDDKKGFFRSREDKALMSGVALMVPGAIIGGIIGSVKIKIPFNGNAMKQRDELLKYKLSDGR